MKNNKRPLSVDRLGVSNTTTHHYLYGYRGFKDAWFSFHVITRKKQNEINDDCN